jgi:hypothetical protein
MRTTKEIALLMNKELFSRIKFLLSILGYQILNIFSSVHQVFYKNHIQDDKFLYY